MLQQIKSASSKILVFEKHIREKLKFLNLFYFLVFVYFITLSADLLFVQISLFKFKFNHLVAFVLAAFIIVSSKLVFNKKMAYCFFLILLSILISFIFGIQKYRCIAYVMYYLFEFICYFFIPYNLLSIFPYEKIMKLYFLSFFCIGLYAVSQLFLSFFGIFDPFVVQKVSRHFARPNGLNLEPSYYALYISAFAMFVNTMFIFGDKMHFKLLDLFKIVSANLFLLASTSGAGFLAYFFFLFICLFIFVYKTVRRNIVFYKERFFYFLLSMFSFSVVFSFSFPNFFMKYFIKLFRQSFVAEESFAVRWTGIFNCFQVFFEHPFFGVGLGAVGPYIFLSHGKEMADFENDYYNPHEVDMELFQPTNLFPEILASLGIFGILSFLVLFFLFFRSFKKVMSLTSIPMQNKRIALALFVSLVVVILEAQFNQGLFRNYIWVHAAITFGFFNKMTWLEKYPLKLR